ncbi:Predicted dithiol-disulfide isomerase, DsbA family [Marinobacter daqiaonensis]|uniref:Predicted dithiol-disulfide isomerase, DsbA family n=1 Tax=Marinobacter daqiaonensis TaxID=650891 RepID=A0A1I6HG51_9GAMM|nr:DsbA family oxidoreductase [Marinobacter daqiaonensis]SFR53496.1 Predicted dithiol-disulfide isomerase, DsbA family [Marinobacter daqiaonensis]
MTTLKIDIVSDIACPWCAIGYARLSRAMEELEGEMDFDIEWHAFELNPDKSGQGQPIIEALSQKYGRSPEEMEAAQADMIRIATELGLNFGKMQERYTHNTFDGHRLVKWAGEQGRQTDMKMALFDAYFGHAENIADHDVLIRCVESTGLDGNDAREVLESGQYGEAVREDETRWQNAGVSAVPAFILNGKYMIPGAQEPDTLVQALRKVAAA